MLSVLTQNDYQPWRFPSYSKLTSTIKFVAYLEIENGAN